MKKRLYDVLLINKEITKYIIFQIFFIFWISIAYFHRQKSYAFILYIFVIICALLSYYLLYKIHLFLSIQAEREAKEDILIKQKEIQNEHILASIQANEDLHKIKNEIKSIIQEKKRKNIDVNSDEVLNDIIYSNSNAIFLNYCENKVIDAILYNKMLIMKKNNLRFTILAKIPESVNIRNIALMTVVTNIIDNAIEANNMIDSKQRFVDINFYTYANMLIFKISNPIHDDYKNNIFMGLSSKKNIDNHGYGLEIVRRVCDEYGGNLSFEIKDNIVLCTVILVQEDEKGKS